MTGSKQIRILRARGHLVAFVVAACLGGITAPHGAAAILIVSNTSASGPGSLQQAILDANATNGLDTIIFNIPGAGVHTITPANALPPITDSVVIDATTQPGFDRTPLVELDGSMAGDNDGLRLQAGSSTIRGLAINRFTVSAIHVLAPSGTNSILGNFIGTAPSGSVARGNGLEGVWLSGSTGNLIGGTGTNGNVIAANGDACLPVICFWKKLSKSLILHSNRPFFRNSLPVFVGICRCFRGGAAQHDAGETQSPGIGEFYDCNTNIALLENTIFSKQDFQIVAHFREGTAKNSKISSISFGGRS